MILEHENEYYKSAYEFSSQNNLNLDIDKMLEEGLTDEEIITNILEDRNGNFIINYDEINDVFIITEVFL